MSILVDQCVPQKFKQLLIAWGYPATLVSDHIRANSTDPEVLQLAQTLNASLLTVDLDFSNIIDYPPEQYNGIIVMRYQVSEENQVILTLKKALADLYLDDLKKTLVIISPQNYRVRKGL